MTDRELEQRLADALTHAAPDDLEAILSRCGAQNGSVMDMKALQDQNIVDVDAVEVKPKRKLGPWLAAACAALVLAGGAGGFYYHQAYAVASVVSLDVNPSIELKVNRNEKVISCTPLNKEATAVLFDMDGGADLEGAKLDVAVNAIVGALVREGYLDRVSSAILISVDDRDQARAARLQQELVASVDGVLQLQSPNTAVLSQVLTQDASAPEYMALDSGISSGKAALVRKVMEMNGSANSTEAFDQLAALSVEELNDLLKTGETRVPIGISAAWQAVEEYAGTAALDSVTADVDPELDDLPAHYDVELRTAWGNFYYVVDAFTGAVLSGQADILSASSPDAGTQDAGAQAPSPDAGTQTPSGQTPDTNTQTPSAQTPNTNTQTPSGQTPNTNTQTPSAQTPNTNTQTPSAQTPNANTQTPSGQTPNANTQTPSGNTQDVGQAAAKAAALKHAGLSESQVTSLTCKRDWDDGRLEYDVEFWNGTTEYDYTIDAATGSVIKSEREDHTPVNHTTPAPQPSANQDVGQAAAKQAALNHAGLTESQVTSMVVKQDWDDGRLEYDVEFWCGTTEYDYTIDGYTGAVLKHEWDHHNSHYGSTAGTTPDASGDIGQAAAKKAALTHAGVTESQTYGMKVKKDWDDGRLEYEVEFRSGGMEYEYTIDGVTGAILEYDAEWD